jgi:hypothetical protein
VRPACHPGSDHGDADRHSLSFEVLDARAGVF